MSYQDRLKKPSDYVMENFGYSQPFDRNRFDFKCKFDVNFVYLINSILCFCFLFVYRRRESAGQVGLLSTVLV